MTTVLCKYFYVRPLVRSRGDVLSGRTTGTESVTLELLSPPDWGLGSQAQWTLGVELWGRNTKTLVNSPGTGGTPPLSPLWTVF